MKIDFLTGRIAPMFVEMAEKFYFKPRREILLKSLSGEISQKTLEAMNSVPRHLFVAPYQFYQAYKDKVLPIMKNPSLLKPLDILHHFGLTSLSQPAVVGKMTDLLSLKKTDKVFEIGTATGYQAAVISKLAKEVTTVDIFSDLCFGAKKRLTKLGINNVQIMVADAGSDVIKKCSFDKVIATVSVPPIPPYPSILELLKPNGLAVIPFGGRDGQSNSCELLCIKRVGDKFKIIYREAGYQFVPMQGEQGWDVFYYLLSQNLHSKITENLSKK